VNLGKDEFQGRAVAVRYVFISSFLLRKAAELD
jgi:hypothetical protein